VEFICHIQAFKSLWLIKFEFELIFRNSRGWFGVSEAWNSCAPEVQCCLNLDPLRLERGLRLFVLFNLLLFFVCLEFDHFELEFTRYIVSYAPYHRWLFGLVRDFWNLRKLVHYWCIFQVFVLDVLVFFPLSCSRLGRCNELKYLVWRRYFDN
jgi:hypothetical protein